MISPTANWLAANANLKRKPVYLIEVAGYARAFTTLTNPSATFGASFPGLTPDIVLQAEAFGNIGGLSLFPGTVTLPKTTPSGNVLLAFMVHGDTAGGSEGISDTNGNSWTQILSPLGGPSGTMVAWKAVSNGGAADSITFTTGANRSNSAFFVVELPAAYASFVVGHNSGSGSPATVTTSDGDTLTVPNGPNISSGWSMFSVSFGSNLALGFVNFSISGQGPSIADQSVIEATPGGGPSYIVVGSNTSAYEWLVNVGDVTLTISDTDGGADLSDLVFNAQDRGQAITADMESFVFEGKKVALKEGFVGLALADYLTRFVGKIDNVASDNVNQEYTFTCPDIRKDLSKVIFQTGDDGFPTDSNHPKTLNGHPLDILLDLLQTEVGWAASEIDIAGIQNYRDTVFSGDQMEFTITSPPAAKDFIENEILKPRGGYHWPDNLGIFRVHFFYPLAPASVSTLDHTNLLNVPLAGQAELIDQVTVRFDESSEGKFLSEAVRNFQTGLLKYGLFGEHVIESAGTRAAFQGYFMAAFIAGLIFLRYGNKQLEIDGVGTRWSESLLDPGDIVSLTSSLVPDRIGGVMGVTGKTFEMMDRTWSFMSQIATYKVLEVDLSKFKQFFITPNAEADFTSASSADKAKYLFLCDTNDEYSDSSPANTLC